MLEWNTILNRMHLQQIKTLVKLNTIKLFNGIVHFFSLPHHYPTTAPNNSQNFVLSFFPPFASQFHCILKYKK